MGAGCDEFGDCVREGGVGVHVEDGERVAALVHAAFGKDDADEVNAGGAEEGEGGVFCEELVGVGVLAWVC